MRLVPLSVRQELDRGQRRRDVLVVEAHGGGEDNAAVGHDVLVDRVVGKYGSWDRGAFAKAHFGVFLASNTEVHVEVLDLMVVAFDEPATLLDGVGEGGEYALGGGWIRAFDDECAVDYGWLFHGLLTFLPFRELVKQPL